MAFSPHVIVVTSEWDTPAEEERGAVFATSLAAHLADTSDVLFVDASESFMGMSYLGVPLNKRGLRDTNDLAWKSIRKNEDPIFLDGNDGSGPGGVMEAVAINGKESPTRPLLNNREDVVKLFRYAEESYSYIIVFSPSAMTLNFGTLMGFAKTVFHCASPFRKKGYDTVRYEMGNCAPAGASLTTIFYGVTPKPDGWQVADQATYLSLGLSWNDENLVKIIKNLRSSSSAAVAISSGKSSGSTKHSSQVTTRRGWRFRSMHAVIAASASSGATSFMLTVLPQAAFLSPYALRMVLASGVVAALTTGVRRRTVYTNTATLESGRAAAVLEAGASAAPGSVYAAAWTDIEERHQKVVDAWIEYELDISLSLSFPAMLDHTIPSTAALYSALGSAQVLSSTKDFTVNPMESPYGKAVQSLELAYKVAEDYARKMGRSVWNAEDRPKVETAEKLFSIALSDSASTPERQSAYKQALRTLEGVVAVPQKATQKIEASIALIEAAPHSEGNDNL